MLLILCIYNETYYSFLLQVIGQGPLPPDATTSQKDPRIEDTEKHYYWDSAGRRHRKSIEDEMNLSLVEQAMNAIKRWGAAASDIDYKLNLKQVFQEIDTNNNGTLERNELIEAFTKLGINLDILTIDALFRYKC